MKESVHLLFTLRMEHFDLWDLLGGRAAGRDWGKGDREEAGEWRPTLGLEGGEEGQL